MNKTAIWVIVVVLAGAGLWFFTKRSQAPFSVNVQRPETSTSAGNQQPNQAPKSPATPPSGSPQADKIVVSYTDSGYQPTELHIKAGQTVVFRNGSAGLMWTASDPHPIHTDLSGFDALVGAAAGEDYSFTFTKIGTWGYHNHLRPSHRGKIIVE